MPATTEQLESFPSQLERDSARESSRKLAKLFKGIDLNRNAAKPTEPITIEIKFDDQHEIVSIPIPVLRLMSHILTQMAQGNIVTVVPRECVMTTRQAAHYLNVSRPFLINLLERHEIPYRKVGTHRRIQFGDIMKYKEAMNRSRDDALAELVKEGQDLNLGY